MIAMTGEPLTEKAFCDQTALFSTVSQPKVFQGQPVLVLHTT
jgi:hypothetical protein